eukprot:Colp12_sorted_trinity150504_noHs@22686
MAATSFLKNFAVLAVLVAVVAGSPLNITRFGDAGPSRNINFVNNCPHTVWVGAQGNPLPNNGGWKMDPQQRTSIVISSTSVAVRFWPRTGCRYDSNNHFVCETGDCGAASNNFAMECRGIGGQPPASLAEFTLGGDTQSDFYDLSLVDGYNVGIKVAPVPGHYSPVNNPDLGKYNCGAPTCTMNAKGGCPPELMMVGSDGTVVCASICAAIFNNAQRAKFPVLQAIFNDQNKRDLVCCSCDCGPDCGCENPNCKYGCSPYNPPSPAEKGGKCYVESWPTPTAGAWPNRYDEVFKSQCPDAYSWQFDDHKSTYQCSKADYEITFCP